MTPHSTFRPLVPMHHLSLSECGPPRRGTLATGAPVWLIARHADVRQVLNGPPLPPEFAVRRRRPHLLVVPNLRTPETISWREGQVTRSPLRLSVTW